MKKLLKTLLPAVVFAAALPSLAHAADEGIYDLEPKLPVSITVCDETGAALPGESAVTEDGTVTDFYAGACRLQLTGPEDAVPGEEYLVMVTAGDPPVQDPAQIVYLGQSRAEESGVSFSVFPRELEESTLYHVFYADSDADHSGMTELCSFRFGAAEPKNRITAQPDPLTVRAGDDASFSLQTTDGAADYVNL